MSNLAINFPRNTFFGFDSIFDQIERLENSKPNFGRGQGYPPYNVIKKDDTHYLIEIAVAGFNKDDISLTLEKGELTIEGDAHHGEDKRDYTHRGISARKFIRKFTLSETMVVVGADIVDGLLVIGLENQIPEEDKPKTIKLGDLDKSAKQLLLG
ncbi:MAG: heat-shock protein [Gammaproteobacteria bacterium]|nr:heat-shock protein [Gammaproteobacteria bacterium]|tara:strand:+ start:23997 stop:24461 length:465 start_codon:yes stop_codon:yes gene_type:complete